MLELGGRPPSAVELPELSPYFVPKVLQWLAAFSRTLTNE